MYFQFYILKQINIIWTIICIYKNRILIIRYIIIFTYYSLKLAENLMHQNIFLYISDILAK